MAGMSKRDRVQAALHGQPADRPPVSFWGHDFLREWTAEGLAAAMVEQVRTYDYDYLKLNPRATYYTEAWGCTYSHPDDPLRSPEPLTSVLHQPSDLESITVIDGAKGPFGEQLEALRMIRKELPDVPIAQTLFSPLSVVGRLANDRDAVRRWMTEAPDALHGALAAVTETLGAYARACIASGADGIFFATTEWATHDVLTPELYATFGQRYDLPLLQSISGAEFNILHVCRPNNMLPDLLNYPAGAINWAMHAPGNLSLADVAAKTGKAVMGGVDERHALLRASPDDVRAQVQEAITQTVGHGFLLAPGCSIAPNTPPENLRAAVEAARGA